MSLAREFLRGIIDYAGLFPPASFDMARAVSAFAEYSESDERDLLGRFITPSARLDELSSALRDLHVDGGASGLWRLSVIPGAASNDETTRIRHFNDAHAGAGSRLRIAIDAVEMPVRSIDEIDRAANEFGGLDLFLEPAGVDDPSALLDGIAAAGAAAKIRTGGTVPGSAPEPAVVLRFMSKCSELGLRFKATAGLHHAMRSVYPLTYAPDSPRGPMFGYLNIFLAAAFIRSGLDDDMLLDLLQERDASSISIDESGAAWRGYNVDASVLRATRENFALSFGSCSFVEPVEEARQLHLI